MERAKKIPFSKYDLFNYFVVYLAIAFVNPTIQQYDWLTISFYFLTFGAFFYRKRKLDRFFFFLVLSLLLLLIVQGFKFENFSIKSFLGIIMVWLVPYFIYRVVGIQFSRYYINLLYVLSLIGLIFWLLCNVSNTIHQGLFSFVDLIGTDRLSGESFIIYNLDYHRPTDLYFMKNPGPFAEGGVYSCFLILALVLNTIQIKKLYNNKNIVFIISILTTTSTAGYIALSIFLIVYLLIDKQLWAKIVILPAVTILSFWAFNSIPFLGDKIENQFESQMNMSTDTDVRVGRFQSARVSLLILKDNPISGKGLFRQDRFISKKEEEIGITGTTNGIVNLALKYGIVAWFVYFLLFYRGLKYLCIIHKTKPEFALLVMLPILAVGSAQTPFTSPAYIVVFLQGYYLYRYIKVKFDRNIHFNYSSRIQKT